MGKKSTPAAPDPVATAAAQTQMNKDTAVANSQLNAVDRYGPAGSTTYQFGYRDGLGYVPIAQTTTLTPNGQQIFDTQQGIALDLSNRAQTALDYAPQTPFTLNGVPYDPRNVDANGMPKFTPSNLPYDPRTYGDVSQIDQRAADAVWSNGMARLQPGFDLDRQRFDSNMANRGIAVGSKAYNNANSAMARSQYDAMGNLQNQAYLTGHQVAGDNITREQTLRSNAYNEDLTNYGTQQKDWLTQLQTEQNLRGQVIGENEKLRNSAINDASLYLNGAPALTQPGQVNVPTYNMQPADIMGATYQSYNANAQRAQQQNSSLASGLGSAAMAAAMMFSSRTLKCDIGPADNFLQRVDDLAIKSWRYNGETAAQLGDSGMHVGPMAEDWSRAFGGDSRTIHLGDAVFSLWRAVQQLSDKVKRIEAHV